jgi:signal recognition particle subunit SRP54
MGKKGLMRGGLGALFGKGGGMPPGMPGGGAMPPMAPPPGMALPPGLSGLGRKK